MDDCGAAGRFRARPQCSHPIAADRRRLARRHACPEAILNATARTVRHAGDAAGGRRNLWGAELLGQRAAKRNRDSPCRGSAALRDSALGGNARRAPCSDWDCSGHGRRVERVALAGEFSLRSKSTQPANDAAGRCRRDGHRCVSGLRAGVPRRAHRCGAQSAPGVISPAGSGTLTWKYRKSRFLVQTLRWEPLARSSAVWAR